MLLGDRAELPTRIKIVVGGMTYAGSYLRPDSHAVCTTILAIMVTLGVYKDRFVSLP